MDLPQLGCMDEKGLASAWLCRKKGLASESSAVHGEPSGGWQRLNENTRTNTKLAEKMLAIAKEFISVEIVGLVYDWQIGERLAEWRGLAMWIGPGVVSD